MEWQNIQALEEWTTLNKKGTKRTKIQIEIFTIRDCAIIIGKEGLLIGRMNSNQKTKLSKIRKPRRDFRLRTSDFGLLTSDYRLPTPDFGLRTSDL